MDRRQFILRGGALGCSVAASPLITPIAMASAPWDTRLIVILLRGAMDGLDAVRPVGDPDFAGLRPDITGSAAHHDLNGFFAMREDLGELMPMWQAGELSFVHAVSTPYRDKRSHFDGQDLLEAGIPSLEAGLRDGWLNRLIQTQGGLESNIAFAVGQEQMLILSGDAETSSWAPRRRLSLDPATERLLELVMHDDPLFREASAAALDITESIENSSGMMQGQGGGSHRQLARFTAARLREETRIASFSLTGWDTHLRQGRSISTPLRRLASTLVTLKEELGDVWGKTAIVCMTEFGRTARQNGSDGTDHGTGGAMVLAGGAIRGGQVVSDWPGLSEAQLYDRRDLLPTRDVRAHAAWIMRGLFGLPTSTFETAVFPGLEMGADPGLLL